MLQTSCWLTWKLLHAGYGFFGRCSVPIEWTLCSIMVVSLFASDHGGGGVALLTSYMVHFQSAREGIGAVCSRSFNGGPSCTRVCF